MEKATRGDLRVRVMEWTPDLDPEICGHRSHVRHGYDSKAGRRKRDAGPDILNPQIRALEAMDEALDTDNTTEHNTKGQESLAHESSINAQTMPHL